LSVYLVVVVVVLVFDSLDAEYDFILGGLGLLLLWSVFFLGCLFS